MISFGKISQKGNFLIVEGHQTAKKENFYMNCCFKMVNQLDGGLAVPSYT